MNPDDSVLPQTGVIQCKVCQSTFTRQEHLRRHMRIHTTEKPFHCAQCDKSFSRLDVLHRHKESHGSQQHNTKDKGNIRACNGCAVSRVRCPRGNPCGRCLQKEIPCVYPLARKRKIQTETSSRSHKSPKERGSTLSEPTGCNSDRTEQSPSSVPAAVSLVSQPLGLVGCFQAPNATSSTSDLTENGGWLSLESSNKFATGSYDLIQETIPGFDPRILNNDPSEWLGNMESVNWLSPQGPDMRFPEGYLEDLLVTRVDRNTIDMIASTDGFRNNLFEAMVVDPSINNANMTSVSAPSLHDAGEPDPPPNDSLQLGPSRNIARRNDSNSPEGTYYVEGSIGRAPFGGRSNWRDGIDTNRSRNVTRPSLSHERISGAGNNMYEKPLLVPSVPVEIYQLCVRGLVAESSTLAFDLDIPTKEEVEHFVRLFFEGFHDTYPFLCRGPSLFISSSHWILLLALVATGSRYANTAEHRRLGESVAYITDRILAKRLNNLEINDCDRAWNPVQALEERTCLDLPTLQAALLNCLFLLHDGKKSAVKSALHYRYHIVEALHSLRLLADTAIHPYPTADEDDQYKYFQDWMESESRIRTGWMVWLIDSILVYEFNCTPLSQLGEMNAQLPCCDKFWDLCSSSGNIPNKISQPVTLLEGLEMLYLEKRLPPNLGDLSTNVLIFAICRRSREAVIQHQTELTFWSPNVQKQSRNPPCASKETWPPSIPSLSKWRNAACDCLDILHWNANSTAAQIGGWEHPIILNLHIARLILLAPIRHIQKLTTYPMEMFDLRVSVSEEYMAARYHTLRWAIRDQYKARLSIIHAGALLWHIRRYSTNSFLEPFGIYSATLAIWAYSISVQSMRSHSLPQVDNSEPQSPPNSSTRTEESSPVDQIAVETEDSDVESDLMVIQLDRPCDDEIVQAYVRNGHKMSARMHRIGDICKESAPRRIIKQGIRLLLGDSKNYKENLPGWGVERSYVECLNTIVHGATSPELETHFSERSV